MLLAFLMGQLIAWVYMFTRQRKGYRASDVQALVLMPVVVAGVVVLVNQLEGDLLHDVRRLVRDEPARCGQSSVLVAFEEDLPA